MLRQYEALDREGKGALLRREGLYSSRISEWRKQRDHGVLAAFMPKRGRPEANPRERDGRERADLMIESAVTELTAVAGAQGACVAVGRPRSTHYRRLRLPAPKIKREPAPQPRALAEAERAQVLEVLHSERFADQAPPSVYASLLDEGTYLASVPTMYRILHTAAEVSNQAADNPHLLPLVVATSLNTGEVPDKISGDAGYGCEENVITMAALQIDAYLAQTKAKHSDFHEPYPRGRIPASATPRQRMARKNRTKKGRALYARRTHVAEPPFGIIKQAMGFRQFLLRGLDKVSMEWSLVSAGYNLRRLHDSGRWGPAPTG